MCDDYGVEVSEGVNELRILKEKALSKETLSSGLLCGCKQRLLSNYLKISSNLMNMMAGFTQALSVIDTIEIFHNRMDLVKKIFRENSIEDLITREGASTVACPKMIIMFSIIQRHMEDVLFEEMARKLVPFIGSKSGEKIVVCREILDDIYDFAEAAVFTLSGLRINCSNISDEIYKHPFSLLTGCSDCSVEQSKETCIFLTGRQKVECLHLFMTESFFKIRKWSETYFDIFKSYHNAPEKIHLIMDFKLIDKYTWTQEDCKRHGELESIFGCVYIVNANHINFDGFLVNMVDIHEIKECVLQCDLKITL